MGRPIQRIGDPNNGGGVIYGTKQINVVSGGSPVATTGSQVSPHDSRPVHIDQTGIGSSTVLVGGSPVNRTGDFDTCFHARLGGNPNVLIG